MSWTQNGALDGISGNKGGDPWTNLEIAKWVRELRPGDRIIVIPKALYEGWTNTVKRVEITLYTSCLLPDMQSYARLIPGSNLLGGGKKFALPIRNTYIGGFSWGTSSAGFKNDSSRSWEAPFAMDVSV